MTSPTCRRRPAMSRLAEAILELDEQVRYVATYVDGRLELRERAALIAASAPESDTAISFSS